MKKLLLSLLAVMVAFTAFAQKDGDKITINTSQTGATKEWNLVGESNAISSLKHNANNQLEVYLKGLEDFGAFETYDINKINNITFSIYHESEVGDVNLADPSATEKTKRLYKYLQLNYGSKIISSIIADVNWNHKEADKVYQATGKYPAMNCYDFIHIYVPQNNWVNYNDITPVTEWADAGGLVSLMWHFNVPVKEGQKLGTDGGDGNGGDAVTCTPSKTTFKATNALKDGTWENKWFYQEMEKVAAVLEKLQDAGIVAVWRPFHEAAGNAELKSGASWGKSWFWWGYDGAETYKQLWKAMFEYFQSKGIHNLIWEWTTQNYNLDANQYNNDEAWYPGDKYVDIIGRDLYGTTTAQQVQEFNEIQARYPGKIIALAECGDDANSKAPTANVEEAWNAGAKWSYFMPWYGNGTMPANDWWKAAFKSKNVITRDQVNLNANYVEESAKDAVKNMGLGTNFGNCMDVVAMWMNMNNNSVTEFEKAWGQEPTTKPMVDFLKKEGFNSVRVPVTWFQHMKEDGTVDEAWMNRVQEIVDYIIDNGMYCILNVHHDTGADDESVKHWIKADETNYNQNKEKFEYLWTQIANRFKNYDQHLVFEGYNEMLDANSTWNAPKNANSYKGLNGYAQSFVNAVRATGGNNETRNLIVNTYAAANGNDVLNNFTLPTDKVDGHLAVEVHTYGPWDWFTQKGKWDASCSKEIADMLTRLNNRFISKGIPCVIGEYGTHGSKSIDKNSSASEKQAAADQAADIVKQAKALGVATFYWMSIFEGTDRNVPEWTLPTVADAMKKAYKE